MKTAAIVSLICATGCACGMALASNPNPEWDDQWETLESEFLSGYTQLTSETKFIKAGESYFSPDGRMVIFQAIEIPEEGHEAGAHYAMYVASITRDDAGSISGLGQAGMVSAGNGSASTCGWFHPTNPMRILFGTTTTAPGDENMVGFQRKSSKYSWQFPVEMDIVAGDLSMTYVLSDEATARAKKLADEDPTKTPELSMGDIISVPKLTNEGPIWAREGYDAEGSWSPDARHILYTQLEPGSNNGDIWVYDSTDGSHTPLITADGYDGGPFFSPDGKSICYRSDRRGDNLLQIFVADLEFDANGKIIGAVEKQLTNNEHVNWCPFFTPDGKYLLYATSEQGHGNYEVYAIDSSGDFPMDETPRMRITQARGFDGLPAFTADGQWMIWTAQRGPTRDGEERPSSQLWAAQVNLNAIDKAYQAQRAELIEKKEADSFENYTPED